MAGKSFQVDEDVVDELPEYRPLNFAAVAACVLTLPGALGYFHPAFLIFPLASIVLAIFALRKIASTGASISGSRAAKVALSISIVLICFTISLHVLNSRREYQYAANCAEQWVQRLRGENVREAYLLTLASDQRPTRADEVVSTEIRRGNLAVVLDTEENFIDGPAIKALADPENQVKLHGISAQQITGKRASYLFIYEVHAPKLNPPNQIAVIEALKIPGRDGVNHWQIGDYKLVAR